MAAVFDSPVLPVDLEDPLRVGLFRRSTGDAVGDFLRALAALFLYACRSMTKACPT